MPPPDERRGARILLKPDDSGADRLRRPFFAKPVPIATPALQRAAGGTWPKRQTPRPRTEAEGLEPPSARARRISSAVPYQLGLRLQGLEQRLRPATHARGPERYQARRRSPGTSHVETVQQGARAQRDRAAKRDLSRSATTIGAPGFEPGTSATRTQRSTGLSHAPKNRPTPTARLRFTDGVGLTFGCPPPVVSKPLGSAQALSGSTPFEPHSNRSLTLHGRGGIRTHAGNMPTRFPVVRLKPLGHPSRSTEGVGLTSGCPPPVVSKPLGSAQALSGSTPFEPHSNRSLRSTEGVGLTSGCPPPVVSKPLGSAQALSGSTPFEPHSNRSLRSTEGVGFEPTWSRGPTP